MAACINCVHSVSWIDDESKSSEGNLVCTNERVQGFYVRPGDYCELFCPYTEEAENEEPFPEESIDESRDRLIQPVFD